MFSSCVFQTSYTKSFILNCINFIFYFTCISHCICDLFFMCNSQAIALYFICTFMEITWILSMWEVVYLNENHMILYGMRPKVKSFFMVKHNEKVYHQFKFHSFFMLNTMKKFAASLNFIAFSWLNTMKKFTTSLNFIAFSWLNTMKKFTTSLNFIAFSWLNTMKKFSNLNFITFSRLNTMKKLITNHNFIPFSCHLNNGMA